MPRREILSSEGRFGQDVHDERERAPWGAEKELWAVMAVAVAIVPDIMRDWEGVENVERT